MLIALAISLPLGYCDEPKWESPRHADHRARMETVTLMNPGTS
jgi:hypothetical protein